MSPVMALVTKNVTENVTKNVDNAVFQFSTFNFEFAHFPLIHRRRDDGPPLLGGAAPFSSRQKRATFPAIGKVYPTKLGRAERAKVDFTFQLSIFNLLAPLCTLKNSPRGEMKQKTREENRYEMCFDYFIVNV